MNNYKIGIGVTTYNSPERIEKFKEKLFENIPTGMNYNFIIADDTKERKGIAFRKNECLIALKHCDYIFLYDDDCFPINKNIWNAVIEIHKRTNEHHFLFNLPEKHKFMGWFKNDLLVTEHTGGVFMFLTKEAIEKVGAFNEEFGFYGFEHAEYSQRVHYSGLNSHPFLTPYIINEYLFAEDYMTPNFESTVRDSEKIAAIENFGKYENIISKLANKEIEIFKQL
jgi:hypothetical protein